MGMKLKGIICRATVSLFLITVFAGNAFGGINEWTSIGPNTNNVTMFAVDLVNPAILFVMTEKTATQSAFKTMNYGSTWSPIDTSGITVNGFGIDPVNHNTLYVGTSNQVIKSTDGGNSWNVIYTAPAHYFFNDFAIDPVDTRVIYAATIFSGVLKSTDSGVSWNSINTGMTGINPSVVAIDPSNNSIIYACTLDALFKSTNSGASWSKMNDEGANDIAIDPLTPSTIYIAAGSGIFKSINGGVNWSEANTGLPDGGFIQISRLAIDPQNPANIYAGSGEGVFRSTNAGETWNAVNTGMTNTSVTTLAIDPSAPANLYAGTEGGLFKITFQSTGTLYLNYTKLGAGYGTVSSNPSGIYCTNNCSALFNDGDLVTLHATPATGSLFMGWSGQCSGTGDCTIFMDEDKSVSARFDLLTEHLVEVLRGGIPWMQNSLRDAYDFAESGDAILAMGTDYIEDLNCDRHISVSLHGGYEAGFVTCSGYTTLKGNLTIADGALTLENLVIK